MRNSYCSEVLYNTGTQNSLSNLMSALFDPVISLIIILDRVVLLHPIQNALNQNAESYPAVLPLAWYYRTMKSYSQEITTKIYFTILHVLDLIWAYLCCTKFCKLAIFTWNAHNSKSYQTKYAKNLTCCCHHIEDHMWVLTG